LERGELVVFEPCPFPLPDGDDRVFLLTRRQKRSKKNIHFNPAIDALSGHVGDGQQEAERLRSLLAAFSHEATRWVSRMLPEYATAIVPDQASFRPLEEAVRRLRPSARNDLLHVDTFPSRPTQGRRILRLYANINPHEARVWSTSDSFVKLLHDHGSQVGLPRPDLRSWTARLSQGVFSLLQPGSE